MNTLLLKANWNIAKGKLRQTLGRLADDTIEFTDGKHDELVGRIQRRTALGHTDYVPTMPSCNGDQCQLP
jgi:uncharacterized protein YjbJ (UPF0337 family)